ncbi:DegT/DnrJ/EryC1/StrS family aminotransferase [Thermoproteota archaeon]
MTRFNIPFHKVCFTDNEIQAVSNTIKSGWITMGPKTLDFENRLKAYLNVQYALAVSSATAALHLALKAIGLKSGDEVILPTNTFVASAEVVTYFKAKPVLCDCDELTHNIDPDKIEALITSKTKAIMPVHFAGIPCEMDKIMDIAKAHKLHVIEDAAHALPSRYKGKLAGCIGDIGCYSFYATKTLSTGEGGMAVSSNPKFAESIKVNRLHGIKQDAWNRYSEHGDWFYQVVDNGFKYNMTDINASLGIEQLKKLDRMTEKRTEIANQYTQGFSGYKHINYLKLPSDCRSSWHLYVIKVKNRNQFIQDMKKAGITCSVHFIPIHKHPYYKKTFRYKEGDFPVANQIFEQSVSLPIYPDLIEEQVVYIIDKTIKYASQT